MTLLEPDVALTDLGLALLCSVLAHRLRRGPADPVRVRFILFFAALGAGAFLGFVEHGLVADKTGWAEAVSWSATLLGIGAAAGAGYAAAARLLLAPAGALRAERAVAAALAGYAALVLLGERRYLLAIALYLPAALLLGVAFAAGLRRTGDRRLRAGLWGLALSFVAAGLQQARVALHPRWFDHNALYHLVQAVGLVLLARGAGAAARDPREALTTE